MRRWSVVAALIAALTGAGLFMPGCRGSPPRPVPKPRPVANPPISPLPAQRAAWRASQADEVREVALRYAFGQYGPYVQGKRWRKELLPECTFFLSIEGKEPSNKFLQRFAGEGPTIKKHSEWKSYLATSQTDRFLGQTAAFDIVRLQWETEAKVIVGVGGYMDQRERCWWKLVVANRNGRWTVDRSLGFAVT